MRSFDPEMVYTCAYFRDWNNDLATAQRDKPRYDLPQIAPSAGKACSTSAVVGHLSVTPRKYFGVRAHGVTLADEHRVCKGKGYPAWA